MTFTKLFSSITESTVWCENNETRLVWITMLAMANKNGYVFGSVPGLANRARVPVEATREALRIFQQPDPDSRTKDHEGRRIEEVDGGWRLLTYEKHRAIRDEEERREYMKNLMREKRAVSRRKPPLSQAEAEAESRIKGRTSPNLSDSNPTELARLFLEHEEICIPVTKFEISDTASALEAIQKQEKLGTPFEAMEWALEKARAYKKASKVVGPGWMRKALYNQIGPKKQVPMVRVMDLIEKERAQ